MALKILGTLATTTLQGAQYSSDPNVLSATDFATIANAIFRDAGQMTGSPFGGSWQGDAGGNKPGTIAPGAFVRAGLLYIQLRGDNGPLQVFPGDWVAHDQAGNVFLIPARACPKTLTLANCTTVSGSPVITFPSSVIALGWQNGTHVTGTNIPANSVLGDLAANGLSANLYSNAAPGVKVNATGSASNTTVTAGTWTHS